MTIAQQAIQLLGLYVSGALCLGSAVLKLTWEGHWSWWRVLLPLWAVLGHNMLYSGRLPLAVLCHSWTDRKEDITIREDAPQRYEFAAMLRCLLFAHNLLECIEGAGQRVWVWLGTGQWQLLSYWVCSA